MRFSHIVACSCNSFILIAIVVWICRDLFIHSIPDEPLGCFQFLAVRSRPAVNILILVCLHYLMALLFLGDRRNIMESNTACSF